VIDPRDVIRRYSIEELNETAEEYYRRIDDPTPLMSKPFTFLHEAPMMLENLGLLLSGLHLGKTMTVLDFGAGTCWLSRFLAQLNCQVISCDVSATALAIGRRLFEEFPLIGTAVYRPRFLPFDGHRIDLPDESVDRIVCFDAFHHVPNGPAIIGEFARVLKRGGVAGFSEPGRLHSQGPQSQYEMQNHRVLENDIDVNQIFTDAQALGFTRLSLKAAIDLEMSLDDQNVLFAPPHGAEHERLKSEIWNQTYNAMTSRAIFFLHKGPLVRDSRSHIGLAHTISAHQASGAGPAGRPISLSFTIANTGDARWLHTNDQIFGIVRLASHLYDASGTLLSVDFSRHELAKDVLPGESIDMTVSVTLPRPGRYRLGFDLVAEGVTWFEIVGSRPVYIDLTIE
jgi:SAM-dependent methyltransferase